MVVKKSTAKSKHRRYNEHFRRTVFQTQQRAILLSPNTNSVHGVQLSGEQRRPEGKLLAVHENHRGKLWVLSKRSTRGHRYSQTQLQAFADQLSEEGLMVRIIVRSVAGGDLFEILAGHNRTNAARLAGWKSIPAEIVDADDARAVVIATSTNLIQRQDLSIIERGKAYKALLDAKNRNGQRNAAAETFGDSRQRYNARTLVAEFFGVTEYEIRKAIKLTQLIPELTEILESSPKQLNLACAELMADYDSESQQAFIGMCTIEGYQINKAAVRHIVSKCPPPTAPKQAIYNTWHEARAAADSRIAAPPKKISFDRKRFAPYLDKLGSNQKLEDLFLEFLQERVGV